MPETFNVSFRFDYIKNGLTEAHDLTIEHSFGGEPPQKQTKTLMPGHTTAVNLVSRLIIIDRTIRACEPSKADSLNFFFWINVFSDLLKKCWIWHAKEQG